MPKKKKTDGPLVTYGKGKERQLCQGRGAKKKNNRDNAPKETGAFSKSPRTEAGSVFGQGGKKGTSQYRSRDSTQIGGGMERKRFAPRSGRGARPALSEKRAVKRRALNRPVWGGG